MIFKIMLSVYFLNVQYSAASYNNCTDNSYFNGTRCLKCPSTCASCQSHTNCTRCKDGFFGNLCTTPCLQNCSINNNSHSCHQEYGHCAYGCPDGRFALENETGCAVCPDNCGQCSSMTNCFTCKNNFYGPSCTEMCPVPCVTGLCNFTTGHCNRCKEGYFKQNGNCLSCSKGCINCENAKNCLQCQKTHVGPIRGQCTRKCSANSTNFVSGLNQICGITLEKMNKNPPECLPVNVGRSYTCTILRYCIDCGMTEDKCNSQLREGRMCVMYERCITDCEWPIRHKQEHEKDRANDYALCTQKCSIYNTANGKTNDMCQLQTDDTITGSEEEIIHISCFQKPEAPIHSPEDHSTVIGLIVVLGCIVVALLIGKVTYQHRKSFAVSIGRSRFRFPAIAQQEERIQRYCPFSRVFRVTRTLNSGPSVESVHDRENCLQYVADNSAGMPPLHRDSQDCRYETIRYSQVVIDNPVQMIPLQVHDVPYEEYDTTHSPNLAIEDFTNITVARTPKALDVDDDVYVYVATDKKATRGTLHTEISDIPENDSCPERGHLRACSANTEGYSMCKVDWPYSVAKP